MSSYKPGVSTSTATGPVSRAAFYCAVCEVQFSDSHAAEAHKASLKHKKKSGELEWETRTYKKDNEVTAEDVWTLVRRKQEELELKPWSELRCPVKPMEQ